MGRPRKQGLSYFPHDCDAITDEKIERMMELHGLSGYAFYFIILERIYKNGGKIEFHQSFTGISTEFCKTIHGVTYDLLNDCHENDTKNNSKNRFNPLIRILSRQMWITEKQFVVMLNDAIEIGLFEKDDYFNNGILTSGGIQKRVNHVEKERERSRANYEEQREEGEESFTGVSPEFHRSFTEVSTEIVRPKVKVKVKDKVKGKIKEKEQKNTSISENTSDSKPEKKETSQKIKTPMPDDFCISPEIKKWADERGFKNLDAHLEYFKDACAANGYKYKDWNAAFRKAVTGNWGNIPVGDNGSRGRGNKYVGLNDKNYREGLDGFHP